MPGADKTHIQKASYTFPDWTGKDLGEFTVDRIIGTGGMGVVYEGNQKSLNRKVAIKVLPASLSQQEDFLALFLREAKVLAALSHPNIVSIYSFGHFEGCPYFAMELLRGETLRDKIEKRKHMFFKRSTLFPIDDVLRWVRQAGAALEYAHGKGVVHRDIKPSNILVDEHDRVFVTDFGLVHLLQMAKTQNEPCGTPSTMSFEQARGAAVDAGTDVYSLGCVMHELLTGSPVSTAQTVAEALAFFEKNETTSPATKNPAIPLLLDQIVVKALQKNKEQRYQSMGEFLAVLEQFSSGKLQAKLDPQFRVRSKKLRRGRPPGAMRSMRVVALLALLGAIGYFALRPSLENWQAKRKHDADAWCTSQWQIAQNYLRNDRKEPAAEVFRKIVDRYPKHPVADQAREELRKLEQIS